MDDLTKEQQNLLVSMYKEVISRQPALPFHQANYFSDSDEILNLFMPDSDSDHVADLCFALKSKGYISCDRGDDLALEISMTDRTIIYMENRFKNGINDVLDFLLKFKP